MKTAEEMTKSILLKRDKYIQKKKNQKKLAYRIIAVVVCISLCLGTATLVKNARTPVSTPEESVGESTSGDKSALLFVKSAKPVAEVTYPASIKYDDYEALSKNRESNALSKDFLNAYLSFSAKSGSEILKSLDANQNYSPLSLYYALSVCASGANGETQSELLALLGIKSIDELQTQCEKLYNLSYSDNGIGKLKSANSLWLNESLKFKDMFIEGAKKSFFTEAFYCDFNDENTTAKIGKWINSQTNGTLTPSIRFDDPDNTALAIVNTVWFYDEWETRFREENNITDAFYANDGTVRTEYMRRSALGKVRTGESFTGASLDLKSGGRVDFILPNEGTSLSELYKTEDALYETLYGGTEKSIYVNWQLPRFSFSCSYTPLNTALKALGITNAFDPEKADFSSIADTSEIPIFLSGVTQETYISVNEKGVEASAYTMLYMNGSSALPKDEIDFFLNRPFMYVIYDGESGLPIFMGTVTNPTSN